MSITLQLRLRNFKDLDISNELSKFPNLFEMSDILREALRFYLFGEDTPIKNKRKDVIEPVQREIKRVEIKTIEIQPTKVVRNSDISVESKLSKLLDF